MIMVLSPNSYQVLFTGSCAQSLVIIHRRVSYTPQHPPAEGIGVLPRQKGDNGNWILLSLSW